MKKTLFFILISLCAGKAPAQVPSYVDTNGLLAWYPFDSSAANAYSLTWDNGVPYGDASYGTDRYGARNRCYLGDGTSGIDIPTNNFVTGNGARSVASWYKMPLPAPTGNRELFSTGDNSAVGSRFGLNTYVTWIGWESVGIGVDCPLPIDSAWHHLVITYPPTGAGSASIKTYFDGVLRTTTYIGGTTPIISTATSPIHCIGTLFMPACCGSWLYSWIGTLDDMGVWNREISACDVAYLYYGGNRTLAFVNGHVQHITVCENGTLSLDSVLAVNDSDVGLANTWSTYVGPTHGTLVSTYATTSTGSTMMPASLSYSPDFSYLGRDSFSVIVKDCNNTADTTTVIIAISPMISAGVISGASAICAGSSLTLTDSATGGIWTSSAPGIATVGTAGIVSGVSSGTAIITYSVPFSCSTAVATKTVTVDPVPAAITGTTILCEGASTTLADLSLSGSWSSSMAAVAAVGSSTGMVSGVLVGTATITYELAAGCIATIQVTVHPSPAAIAGSLQVCPGLISALTDATTGGTWSCGASAIASAGASSGLITGLVAGTTTITYTLGTGCKTISTVTVNPNPAPIAGVTTICLGYTTTLTDVSSGGVWTSGSSFVSTGSSSGIVTGLTLGISTISYIFPTGCYNTVEVDCFPNPSAIAGPTTLCTGATTTLTDGFAGGTWISSNSLVAPVISSTGFLTGVSAGTACITYTLSTNCSVTTTVTVGAPPTAITGPGSVCAGTGLTLGNGVSGGAWSSSNGAVAYMGTLTGILTGVSAGTTYITYSLGSSCMVTRVETVLPSPTEITGPGSVCIGSVATFIDLSGGGGWMSSSLPVATIGESSGILSGVSAGTTILTYAISSGCFATHELYVTALPGPIMGPSSVCIGALITLTDGAGSGAWSASSGLVSVGSSGSVMGVAAGTSVVTYSVGTGCLVAKTITVSPQDITGDMRVCPGITTALSDASGGGVWSSSSTGIATIGSDGVALGVSAGTSVISYLADGCIAHAVVTVNPLPGPISGAANSCAGFTSVLTEASSGGTWSSSDASVATIGALTGILSGIRGGTVTITYTLPTGCITTTSLAVNPTPLPITGASPVCVAASTAFHDAVIGGTWSSNATAIALVSGSGSVTAVSAGTALISYAVGGCATEKSILVNPLPAPITGPDSMCEGLQTIAMHDITLSGAWTSIFVTVDTSGIVTSYGAGVGTVTYTLGTGCYVTKPVTINRAPDIITGGTPYLCIGRSATFTDGTGGGLWSATSASIATIGSTTGIATGAATGNAIITYTIPIGCYATQTVAVNPQPSTISAPPALCAGSVGVCTDSEAGGTWSTGSAAVASVGATSGIINAVSAGTTTITYSVTNVCGTSTVAKTITVNPLPDAGAITGPNDLCQGSSITLSETVARGTWSISNARAAVSGGVVRGFLIGSDTVFYTVSNAWCVNTATYDLTIHPVPSPGLITGDSSVCQNASATLIDDAGGGTWSSSNANATVAAGGLVTGVTPGSDTIYYTVSTAWCSASAAMPIAVTPLPDAGSIVGPNTVCLEDIITLQDAVSGGTWSSSSAKAHVAAGIVTGKATGIAIISYSVSNTCGTAATNHIVTINPLPDAGVISGQSGLCEGDSMVLSETVANGIWVSINTSVCLVSSGLVNGIDAGTDTIEYQVTNSCGTAIARFPVIVSQSPLVPVITQNATMVKVPNDYLTYQWSSGSKPISGATNYSYLYQPYGVYQVSVSNSAGCAAASAPYTAVDCTSDEIIIFPNPASSSINILWCKSVNAVITTIDGKKLKTVENTFSVDIGDLPNAEYMLILYDPNGNRIKAKQFTKVSK